MFTAQTTLSDARRELGTGGIMSDETRKHIARVNELLHLMIKGLLDRGVAHDASKLREPEAEVYERFTQRLSDLKYGSQEYKDCLEEMKPALDHHYARNRHHPQHFPNGVEDMTLIDVVEMVCDWKASSEQQNDGNILKSIEHNRARFGIDDQLAKILVNTVNALGFVEG
jgi:hypothetical protein